MDPTNKYTCSHVLYHLYHSGRSQEAYRYLFSLSWMLDRVRANAVTLVRDVDAIYKALCEEKAAQDVQSVEQLLSVLQLSLPAISREPESLVPQLIGRLSHIDARNKQLQSLRNQAMVWRKKDWWMPVSDTFEGWSGLQVDCFTQCDPIQDIHWSQDERLMAIAINNDIWVWDTVARNSKMLCGHTNQVQQVLWVQNLLHSISQDRQYKTWDVEQGVCISTIRLREPLRSFAVGEGCTWMSDFDNQVFIHKDGVFNQVQSCMDGTVHKMVWSHKKDRICTLSGDNTLRVWNKEGKSQFITDSPEFLTCVAWNDDDTMLCVGCERAVCLVETEEGNYRDELCEESCTAVAWCGNCIAVGLTDGRIYVRNVAEGAWIFALHKHEAPIHTLQFSKSCRLASASADGSVRIWKFLGAESVPLQPKLSKLITCVAWSPNHFYTGSSEGMICKWNLADGTCVFLKSFTEQNENPHTRQVTCLEYSVERKRLYSGGSDGYVLVWEQEKVIQCFKQVYGGVVALALSPNQTILCSTCTSGQLFLWDTNVDKEQHPEKEFGNVTPLAKVDIKDGLITTVKWLDDDCFFGGTFNKSVYCWNVKEAKQEDYKPQAMARLHMRAIRALARHGDLFATGDRFGMIYVWRHQQSTPIAHWRAHPKMIDALVWLDASTLCSSSKDGLLRIWKVETKTCNHEKRAFLQKPWAMYDDIVYNAFDCSQTGVSIDNLSQLLWTADAPASALGLGDDVQYWQSPFDKKVCVARASDGRTIHVLHKVDKE